MGINSRVSPLGFTLVEVLVALVVGALVVESARRILEALADSHVVIRRDAAKADSDANAKMLVRALVRQLTSTSAAIDTIVADNHSVRFTSSCETASGWSERCRVRLALVKAKELRLSVEAGERIRFETPWGEIVGPLLYLDQSGDARQWKSLPGDRVAALGIVRARDTLILPVGAGR